MAVGYPPSLEELYRQMSSSPAFAQMMMRQDQKEPGGASWLDARQRVHGLNIPPLPQQAMAPPPQMPSQAFSALGAPPGPPPPSPSGYGAASPQMPAQAPKPMGLPPMPQAQNQPSRGLLSGLIPEGGEFGQRLGDMLMGFGGGKTWQDSLAQGGRAIAEGRRARAPLRAQTAQDNRTREYAIRLGMDPNMAMGLDGPNLMKWIMEKGKPADPMDALKLKREQLEIGNLENPKPDKPITIVSSDGKQYRSINPSSPSASSILQRYYDEGWFSADYATTDDPDKLGGSEAGLNLVYWKDENGKLHGGQTLKGGGIKEVPLPEGSNWAPGVGFLDTATGYMPYDKRGGLQEGAAVIPKDLAGAAAQKELGKQTGEAAALYASLSSKMPGLQKVIGELGILADQATYTQAGQAFNTARKELGLSPTDAAVARAKYIAMVDNQVLPMLRDTFGAQFTVIEGESLRATLGDPNKTPEEKKAVLNAFIEQKVRNIEASAKQGNVDPAQAPPIPQAQPDFSTMSDEELEAIVNGP